MMHWTSIMQTIFLMLFFARNFGGYAYTNSEKKYMDSSSFIQMLNREREKRREGYRDSWNRSWNCYFIFVRNNFSTGKIRQFSTYRNPNTVSGAWLGASSKCSFLWKQLFCGVSILKSEYARLPRVSLPSSHSLRPLHSLTRCVYLCVHCICLIESNWLVAMVFHADMLCFFIRFDFGGQRVMSKATKMKWKRERGKTIWKCNGISMLVSMCFTNMLFV